MNLFSEFLKQETVSCIKQLASPSCISLIYVCVKIRCYRLMPCNTDCHCKCRWGPTCDFTQTYKKTTPRDIYCLAVLSCANVPSQEALTVIVRRITTYMRCFIFWYHNYGSPVTGWWPDQTSYTNHIRHPAQVIAKTEGIVQGGLKSCRARNLKPHEGEDGWIKNEKSWCLRALWRQRA